VILLHASTDTPPAEAMVGIALCLEHRLMTTPASLITDDGWIDYVRMIIAAGGMPPSRALTRIAWRRVTDPTAAALLARQIKHT
jgi:hypothetical protein